MAGHLVAFVCLLTSTAGIRIHRKNSRAGINSTSSKGVVDGLYPVGAPGSADPPLKNPLCPSGCFPGARFWTAETHDWGKEVDIVTKLSHPLGYRHPKMPATQLDLKTDVITDFKCDDEIPNMPQGKGKIIHHWPFYNSMAVRISPFMKTVSLMAIPESFNYDLVSAAQNVEKFGWKLVGSAINEGGFLYVGKQVSHLMQEPNTKECMVTFQGTSSLEDWVSNLNAKRGDFCGLVTKRESRLCARTPICRTKGSFVHKGFRDVLRAMVGNEDWQSNVHAKLPSCSKVYVIGHSLGAATAGLFTACAHQNLKEGDFGYEDHKLIAWTKGTPSLIQAVA